MSVVVEAAGGTGGVCGRRFALVDGGGEIITARRGVDDLEVDCESSR